MHSATVKRIIRAYDDPIVRAYCWARFGILRQRFLDEIGQYLPEPRAGARHRLRLRAVLAVLRGHRARVRFVRGLDVSGRRIAHGPARGRPARRSTTSPTRRATPATSRATVRSRPRTCSTSSTTCHRHGAPAAPRPARQPAGGRSAPDQGRRHASRAEALVHVGAGSRDGAADAGALLERRRARRGADRRGLRGPSPPDGATCCRTRTSCTCARPGDARGSAAGRHVAHRRLRADRHPARGLAHRRRPRDREHHRAQRRGQVHRVQDDRGLSHAARRARALQRRGHHRHSGPTWCCAAGSPTCRRAASSFRR